MENRDIFLDEFPQFTEQGSVVLKQIGKWVGELYARNRQEWSCQSPPRVYVVEKTEGLVLCDLTAESPIIWPDSSWWQELSRLVHAEDWGWDFVRWTFAHEFGHKLYGDSETLANQFAERTLGLNIGRKGKELHAEFRRKYGISVESSPEEPETLRHLLFVDCNGEVHLSGSRQRDR